MQAQDDKTFSCLRAIELQTAGLVQEVRKTREEINSNLRTGLFLFVLFGILVLLSFGKVAEAIIDNTNVLTHK